MCVSVWCLDCSPSCTQIYTKFAALMAHIHKQVQFYVVRPNLVHLSGRPSTHFAGGADEQLYRSYLLMVEWVNNVRAATCLSKGFTHHKHTRRSGNFSGPSNHS